MFNKEDINKYTTEQQTGTPMGRTDGEMARSAGATAGTVVSMVWKLLKTVFWIAAITGCIVLFSVVSVIWSYRDTTMPMSLSTFKLKESSTIYVSDQLHIESVDTAQWREHEKLYATEIRTRVDFTEIPQIMKDAMVAIEDKRFYEHDGVDWKGTGRAIVQLATGTGNSGGSTITQQLIKNLTGENQVSIMRKIKEIFMALNLEKEYTKDEILEAYLNLVNYGNGYYGVQAAAKGYFGKNIWDCNIAECATIAATTKNPYGLNVFYFPEANKKRRDTVILEMYNQNMITKDEYVEALEQSENLKLRGIDFDADQVDDDDESSAYNTWNWYDEEVFKDTYTILQEYCNLDYATAIETMYSGGLKIYSAQYVPLQEAFEDLLQENWQSYSDDPEIWSAACLMEYDGRILAVNSNKLDDEGNIVEKKGRREFSLVSDSTNQPGSSIKPIGVYALGVEHQYITYGSLLKDEALPNYNGKGKSGPKNFSGRYNETGYVNVDRALTESLNAPVVQLLNQMSPMTSYTFLTEGLGLSTLTENDANNLGGVSLGGLEKGVTVREMTGAYQIFGNGGKYYEPYTVYRIEDHEGNVLYDYQDRQAEQVISFDTATIMNKMLHLPIIGVEGAYATAWQVYRSGLDQIGKTGTTDDECDVWYMGATPSLVCGIWNGHETKSRLQDTNGAKTMYKEIINWLDANYNELLYSGSYPLSDNVVRVEFCRDSGLRPSEEEGMCPDRAYGWYSRNNIPGRCDGTTDHLTNLNNSPSPSPTPTPEPTPPVVIEEQPPAEEVPPAVIEEQPPAEEVPPAA